MSIVKGRNAQPKISNRRTGSQAEKVPRPDQNQRKPGDTAERNTGVAQKARAGHDKPAPGEWNYNWYKKRNP
jgi:hypothetical protein